MSTMGQKPTCAAHYPMSAMGQDPTLGRLSLLVAGFSRISQKCEINAWASEFPNTSAVLGVRDGK